MADVLLAPPIVPQRRPRDEPEVIDVDLLDDDEIIITGYGRSQRRRLDNGQPESSRAAASRTNNREVIVLSDDEGDGHWSASRSTGEYPCPKTGNFLLISHQVRVDSYHHPRRQCDDNLHRLFHLSPFAYYSEAVQEVVRPSRHNHLLRSSFPTQTPSPSKLKSSSLHLVNRHLPQLFLLEAHQPRIISLRWGSVAPSCR